MAPPSKRPASSSRKPAKAPSKPAAKAAKPAPKAAARKPAAPLKPLTEAEIAAKLARLDPSWVPPRVNRFAASVSAGKKGHAAILAGLSDADPAARADAATAAADAGIAEAVPALKGLLNDPLPPVRASAALGLVRLGDKPFFEEMVKSLKDPSPKVVCGAATALGASGNREAVPYLLEAYQTLDTAVASAIATALGRLGDARAASHLAAALRAGVAPAEAAEALGRVGDAGSTALLVRALGLPDEATRANAARALGMLKPGGSKRDLELREKVAVPALKLALEDESPKVRLCAALSLFELGERGAGAALVEALHAA